MQLPFQDIEAPLDFSMTHLGVSPLKLREPERDPKVSEFWIRIRKLIQ